MRVNLAVSLGGGQDSVSSPNSSTAKENRTLQAVLVGMLLAAD
jgi:hypothetical protein